MYFHLINLNNDERFHCEKPTFLAFNWKYHAIRYWGNRSRVIFIIYVIHLYCGAHWFDHVMLFCRQIPRHCVDLAGKYHMTSAQATDFGLCESYDIQRWHLWCSTCDNVCWLFICIYICSSLIVCNNNSYNLIPENKFY